MNIEQGVVTELAENHNGWFLGSFITDARFNTSDVSSFETKWSVREKGSTHTSDKPVDPSDTSSSLVVLIKGFIRQTMNGEVYILDQPGAYLFYSPNQPHSVEFMEDSVLLTIRWYK